MAEDLGNIASLLGSSFVQTAAMNEDDQNENRKRAMRQQLLYAFAAPIAQQAGQGVVSFAGDMLLGNKAKDFFQRQEGASFQSRLNNLRKPLENLKEQRTLLMKQGKGTSLEESILNLKRQGHLDKIEAQYGHIPNYKAIMGEPIYKPSEAEIKDSKTHATEMDDAISTLEYAEGLTDKELMRRYKETDIGKGKARRFAKRLFTFATRGNYDDDVVFPAMDFMATGGDNTLRDTDYYRLLMDKDGDFNKKLKELVKNASDITGVSPVENLNNIMVRFEAENEDAFKLLTSEETRLREQAIEGAVTQQAKRNNPEAQRIIEEMKKKNIPVNNRTYRVAVLDEAKGISDTKKAAINWSGRGRNEKTFRYIQDQLTKADGRFETFSAVTDTKKRNEITESARVFIANSYERFNQELLDVISELKTEDNYTIANEQLTSAGIRSMADEYVSMMLKPSEEGGEFLATEVRDMPQKSWFRETLNAISGEPKSVMSGIIADPENKLRSFIKNSFIDQSERTRFQQKSLEDGYVAEDNKEQDSEGVFNPGFEPSRINKQLEDIKTSLTLTNEEKRNQINIILNGIENEIESAFEESGKATLDQSYLEEIKSLREKFNVTSEPKKRRGPRKSAFVEENKEEEDTFTPLGRGAIARRSRNRVNLETEPEEKESIRITGRREFTERGKNPRTLDTPRETSFFERPVEVAELSEEESLKIDSDIINQQARQIADAFKSVRGFKADKNTLNRIKTNLIKGNSPELVNLVLKYLTA